MTVPAVSPPAEIAATEQWKRWQEIKIRLRELEQAASEYLALMTEVREDQLWRFDYGSEEQFLITQQQGLSAVNISRARLAAQVMLNIADITNDVKVRESHLRPLHEKGLTVNEQRLAAEYALRAANVAAEKVGAKHFLAAAEVVVAMRDTGDLVEDEEGDQVPADGKPTALMGAVITRLEENRKKAGENRRAAIMKARVISVAPMEPRILINALPGQDPMQGLKAGKTYTVLFYEAD